ncbi:MAG: helix-hairpin-helix domain-containing protein [Candidatus Roizmanbacteria bacterium]
MKHIDRLFTSLRPYIIELILIVLALCISVFAVFFYFHTITPIENSEKISESITESKNTTILVGIEVSGAITHPDVYEVPPQTRLKKVIELAGGINSDADLEFFSKNFNLANYVLDQDKIYIPSRKETRNTSIPETYTSFGLQKINGSNTKAKIKINTGSQSELETLPGIGKITAEHIITNRPYTTISELLSKKSVKKNIYEQILNLIEL